MNPECSRQQPTGTALRSNSLKGCRSAVTLFEMLLVLLLLVIVGSLAAPLLESSFASARLNRGIDQILTTWSQARNHAIEAGRVYQFRFQAEGSEFLVDPWQGGIASASSTSSSPSASSFSMSESGSTDVLATDEETAEELELADWTYEGTLPDNILFQSGSSLSKNDLGQRLVTQLSDSGADEWSAPILFYPDGTTSAASILLKNNNRQYRRATLRALTGVARASGLLTQDDLDRLGNP